MSSSGEENNKGPFVVKMETDDHAHQTSDCGYVGDIETKVKDYSSSWSRKFRKALQPEMLNLMNLFADAEMFLIDGDSLLLEVLMNQNLDWSYGGQFLHLVYLCERYLHLFVRKGAVFELVFFQDYQELWKSNPSLHLARQLLKIHFSKNIESKVLCDFKTAWDPEFVKYVQEFCPTFILLSDGNFQDQLFRFLPKNLLYQVFFHQLNICRSLGIDCAFTTGIEFGTSTLNGYYVAGFPRPQDIRKTKHPNLRTNNKCSRVDVGRNTQSVFGEMIRSLGIVLDKERDCRLLLHSTASCVYLNQVSKDLPTDHHLDLIRVVLLHAVLLTELPLRYRAFSLTNNEIDNNTVLRSYFLEFFAKLQFFMAEFLVCHVQSPDDLTWLNVSDLWDGRLLFTLFGILVKNKREGKDALLSSRTQTKFISLVNSVSSFCKIKIDPFPILTFLGNENNLSLDLESIFISQTNQKHWQSSPLSDNTVPQEFTIEGLIRVNCPLLQDYAGEILDTPSLRTRGVEEQDVATLVASGNDFDEAYHWHSGKPLTDDYERTKDNKDDEEDKKRKMKLQSKHATFLQRYGESLEGRANFKPIVVETKSKQQKKKEKISKKKNEIIETNKRRIFEETLKTNEELWSKKQKELEALVSRQEYDVALNMIEKLDTKCLVEKVNIKRLMMKALVCWKKWRKRGENDVSAMQSCFLTIQELVENHKVGLKEKEKVTLGNYLNEFGFGDMTLKCGLTKELRNKARNDVNISHPQFKETVVNESEDFNVLKLEYKEEEETEPLGNFDVSSSQINKPTEYTNDKLALTKELKLSNSGLNIPCSQSKTSGNGESNNLNTSSQLKQSKDEEQSVQSVQLKDPKDEKQGWANVSFLQLKEESKEKDSLDKSSPQLKESKDQDSLSALSARFQLQHVSHELRRETRSDPDLRVDNFIPETWQRKLLDAVDNKQSALIVAPTSSGKTYASYYCMETVLKEDNEGVVVYVSPTKALVNQVVATCYARYHRKVLPPGKSVCGVFTRDYRTNALNSQILVTVPQCLEILLLSPARQDWVAKIRYVIFDEVHCLGSEIGAEYWEHLLLLIRCPFLALSATIRNPEDLHAWLQTAEHQKREHDEKNNSIRRNSPTSYEVSLVMYNERYNDLEKFNYVKPSEDSSCILKHVHPCSVLTYRQLVKLSKFPAYISLSPREALALYDAMVKTWPEKDTMENLCPKNYFKEKSFISKQDARAYENVLKQEFMTWITDRQRLETVISSLGGEITSDVPPNTNYVINNFYSLLQELEKDEKLPVIIFSYDRGLCELLAALTVDYLEEKEEKIRAKTSSQALAKQEKKVRRQAKHEKRSRDENCEDTEMRKTNSAGVGRGRYKGTNTRDKGCYLFDVPQEEGCSFAGKGVLDEEDGEVIMGQLRWIGIEYYFGNGLRRGVSYHHAGMNVKQRRVVEMLFRKKFLRVVFATGTLALGINMPCKTVVFGGDSVYLDSLQYHQISGRAGRRGFDLLGNVIFLGIPEAKIQRLMTVNLPKIFGNFPLSVTLVLRLLLFVNKGDDREAAMNEALTLLQNPLICRDQPELDLQLKHHFLFSVEMLVRQGLLDTQGNPQGLAGLGTHLHYHEPANLVFVSLLEQGLFHKFCRNKRSNDGKFSKEFLKSLVVILSHLFTNRPLHPYTLLRERSTSQVILEKLPPEFEKGVEKYNNTVHEVFDVYLRTVAVHVYDTMGEDVTLPLSNCKFISTSYCSDLVSTGGTLEDKMKGLSLPYKACSAFAALSGHTDNRLYCSKDLISNIRYQVYTDIKVVPVLYNDVNLNSYAVDYYNHGNSQAIISENDIKHGDAYSVLKDFMLVIKSISVSLAELGPEDGDDVIAAFTQLAQEYNELFQSSF